MTLEGGVRDGDLHVASLDKQRCCQFGFRRLCSVEVRSTLPVLKMAFMGKMEDVSPWV